MKRRTIITGLISAAVVFLTACSKPARTGSEVMIDTDSVLVDTTVALPGDSSIALSLHINFKYLKSAQYQNINDSIIHAGFLVPDYYGVSYDTLTVKEYVSDFSTRYIQDCLHTVRQIAQQEENVGNHLSWSYSVDTEIHQYNDHIITYLASVNVYEGGERMPRYTVAKNFDMNTGKCYRLNDFLDKETAESLPTPLTENFILLPDSIILLYVPGEINLTKEGVVRFAIPHNNIK